jgi:aspartyl protease family protein
MVCRQKHNIGRDLFRLWMTPERIVPARDENGSGRTLLLALVIIAALVVVGGVIAYSNRDPDYGISSHAFARLSPQMEDWAERLREEPCNRTLAEELISGLLDQAEYETIIWFSEQTKAKCGTNEELLSAVYEAQMRSSDFPAAEQTSNQLVAAFSADPNVYGWRAETREKNGNFSGAYADQRTALSLFLDPSNVALSVYYDLARLAARTGHFCEAVATLRDYIAYDAENRRTQQLATIMRNWQARGSCAPSFGTGSAFLRYDPNSTMIVVSVEVNGVPAKMILDTGASRTALTQSLAIEAGIAASASQGAIVTTANGATWIPGGHARSISLGGARLSDVPVFIENSAAQSFGYGIDGLLGLSFLGNFRVRVGGGALELRPLE